jgi:ribulose-phosphate 3-epimerase
MNRRQEKTVQLSPSLICLDLCNLEKAVRELEDQGINLLHVDILDGHFSPSMPIGIDVVRQLRSKTRLAFDVHLMVENNEFFIQEMLGIGVQQMCFHYESASHIDRLLDLIKANNVKVGLALSPATPLTVLDYVLEKLDFVMLLLINPGFAGHAGQSQVPYARRKIAECHELLAKRGLDIPIEVDGRVSFETIPGLVAAGADILVTGTSCLFHPAAPMSDNLAKIRTAIDQGLSKREEARR